MTAVINPENFVKPVRGMPEIAVACYSKETLDRMIGEMDTEIIAIWSNANGDAQIYKTDYKNTKMALFMIDVGAPGSARQMLRSPLFGEKIWCSFSMRRIIWTQRSGMCAA